MTNVAICGCNGKMGKVIYNCIGERSDCKVVAGVDLNTTTYADFAVYKSPFDMTEHPDVIIDFSHPTSLDTLLSYGKTTGTALVIATTGFSKEQIAQIHTAAEQIPVFFTFNMSLGINLLVELAKKAATVLGTQYDIEIVEKHHNQKIDAPSGTAIMLADAINSVMGDKLQYVYDRHSYRGKRDAKEIGIHSIRGGTIVGEHEVIFAGHDEVITLSHTAASKEVLAIGSVNAAVFLKGKSAGLYSMADLV